MPAQTTSDATAVANVLAASAQLAESVKTMFLEGLPHAAADSSEHPFQNEFMSLAGGALQGSKLTVAEELASIEEELKAAEGEVEAIKSAQADAAKALEEAADSAAEAEAAATAAQAAVQEAENEHLEAEHQSASFLQKRKEEQEERTNVDAIIQGPLRLLLDGGWEDEETKAAAIAAVEGLLGELRTDKVLMAASTHALGAKPDGRGRFDAVAIEAIVKALGDHISGIDSKLAETEDDEVNTKAEILGLWAIADCARDASADNDVALAGARRKQKRAQAELDAEQGRAKAQDAEVSERAAKRARVMAQLAEVDEAVAAVERLVAGSMEVDTNREAVAAAEVAA